MKRKLLSLSLALVLLSTASHVAFSQTQATSDPQDWQGMDGLKPRTRIMIEFKGARRDPTLVEFFAIDAASLIVLQAGVQFHVPQRDIQRVSLLPKWSRSRMTKLGSGIGILVGLAIGAKRTVDLENSRPSLADPSPAYGGFLIGALAGATVGALIGGKHRGKVVYESK
jgi:hypothetical protein